MLPCQVHIHPSSTLIHHLIKNLLSGVYPKHVCLCDFRVYGIRNSCQQTNKHDSHDFNKSKQNTFSTFLQESVCQTPASQAQGLNSPSSQPVGYLCEIRTCTLFVIVLIAQNSALLSSERRVGHFTFPSRHFTSPL